MYWRKGLVLLFLSGNCWAAGEWVVGLGAQGDSADGVVGAAFGDLAVAEDTWLSASVARTAVDLGIRDSLNTWYADVGLDHNFGPMGIRVGAAYWGDNELLDSIDARFSGYFRGDDSYLGFNYEYRDFELDLPPFGVIPGREAGFSANGYGLTGRIGLSDNVGLHFGGMSYDYSVDLRLDTSRDIVDYISVSRLSLINSLVDYRANIGLGFNIGLQHIELDVAQWKGAVAGSKTNSYSLRFLAPFGDRSDIEFGLGYDDSESYGEVTIFSVYLYFYGGT